MKKVKMGICPACDEVITTNQRTTHRLVDGAPARIHAVHVVPSGSATGAPNEGET